MITGVFNLLRAISNIMLISTVCRLCFCKSKLKTVAIQEEIIDRHDRNSLLISPKRRIRTCDDNFLKRIRYTNKRCLLLIHLFLIRDCKSRLQIISTTSTIHKSCKIQRSFLQLLKYSNISLFLCYIPCIILHQV